MLKKLNTSTIKSKKRYKIPDQQVKMSFKIRKQKRKKQMYAYDESSFKGISTRVFGDSWLVYNRKKVLFKTFENWSNIIQERIINEIICCKLAEKFNIPVAKYELAKFKYWDGVISYNFLNDKDMLITGYNLLSFKRYSPLSPTLDNFRESIIYFSKEKNVDCNIEEIMFDLFKIVVFDYLTMQDDRHESNLGFILTNGQLKLAPLFDNEFAFAIQQRGTKKIEYKDFDVNNLLYINNVRIAAKANYNSSSAMKEGRDEAKDLISFAEQNLQYLKFIKRVINFNIDKFLSQFKLIYRHYVDCEYLDYCSRCFKLGQKNLKDELQLMIDSNKVEENEL